MDKPVIGNMKADEFEAMIETFIEHRSGEDDRLPAQTFFELLAKRHMEPIEVHVTWLEAEPVITASPEAPLTIKGHRICFQDGRELVLRFELEKPEPAPA